MEFVTGFTLGLVVGVPAGWILFAIVLGVVHVAKR